MQAFKHKFVRLSTDLRDCFIYIVIFFLSSSDVGGGGGNGVGDCCYSGLCVCFFLSFTHKHSVFDPVYKQIASMYVFISRVCNAQK